ncbi:MAG: ABC transporter substrate-binding protein, partial [Myxococcales bacterium]|nr:ABC transporter substrate-binding protein [Myxococcales bacterium]
MRLFSRVAICLALLALGACDDGGDGGASPNDGGASPDAGASGSVYVVGLLADLGEGMPPGVERAVATIAAAGGVRGTHTLEVRAVDIAGMAPEAVVEAARPLLDDAAVVALIGPETSAQMMALAPVAIEAEKPLVAYRPVASEVRRAFAGSPYVWRTRPGDAFQLDWLIRQARADGVDSLGLIVGASPDAAGAAGWFGFFAHAAGYGPDALRVAAHGDASSCADAIAAFVAEPPARLIVAAGTDAELACVAEALDAARSEDGALATDVVVADLGADLTGTVAGLGAASVGLRGWASADATLGLDAAAHDAVLLVAYGLERSGGEAGAALAQGIDDALRAQGPRHGFDADGYARTAEALRAGEPVDVVGAGGSLTFAEGGVDLAGATLGQWRSDAGTLTVDRYVDVGGPGGEPAPDLAGEPGADTFVEPPGPAPDVFAPLVMRPASHRALLVAATGGWGGYAHQADVLARYQLLRARGLSDDDIILVGEDLADHPLNP